MRMRIEDARIASLAELTPRTFVRAGSRSYTGLFSIGMVVGLKVPDGDPDLGLMVLDGPRAFMIVTPSGPVSLRVLSFDNLHISGIDELDESAHDQNIGSVTIRSDGPPVLRGFLERSQRGVHIDLSTGLQAIIDSEENRESFRAWSLISVDKESNREEAVAVGPRFNQSTGANQ